MRLLLLLACINMFLVSEECSGQQKSVFQGRGEITFIDIIEDRLYAIGSGVSTSWLFSEPNKIVDRRTIVPGHCRAYYSRKSNKIYIGNANKIFTNSVPYVKWEIYHQADQAIFDFEFSANEEVLAVATGLRNFPPDGHDEGKLVVLNITNKKTVFEKKFRNLVKEVAFYDKQIAISIENSDSVVFDRLGKELYKLKGTAKDLFFSTDGEWLCLTGGSQLKGVTLVEAESGRHVGEIPKSDGQNLFYTASFSEDGKLLATGEQYVDPQTKFAIGRTRIFSVPEFHLLQEIRDLDFPAILDSDFKISATKFVNENSQILMGSSSGKVKLWDIER